MKEHYTGLAIDPQEGANPGDKVFALRDRGSDLLFEATLVKVYKPEGYLVQFVNDGAYRSVEAFFTRDYLMDGAKE